MLGFGCSITAISSPPGTLPNGDEPTIFADFVNAVYTKDGAPTTIDDILTEDTENFGSWSGVTEGVGVSGAPAFTGAVLARMVVGATFVIEWTSDATGDAISLDMFDAPDWNSSTGIGVSGPGDNSTVALCAYANNGATTTAFQDASGIGAHKLAVTLANGKIAISVDGQTADVVDPSEAWTAVLNAAGPYMYRTAVMTNFAIYPVQDDGDLSQLSA
jgi:hypothetical protein